MDRILNIKILSIMLIALVILIKTRRNNVCRILLVTTSLFELPFILYTYPSMALDALSLAIGLETKVSFEKVVTFLIIASITFIIIGVLVKLNIKPLSKNPEVSKERKEYIRLKQGRCILQYTIWYTLYITIIHLPNCILTLIVSSFSPMVIMYAPGIIFELSMMYGLVILMSINGAVRVKGKAVFKVLLLMFMPLVNFIAMIKLSYEAKKRLKELAANLD